MCSEAKECWGKEDASPGEDIIKHIRKMFLALLPWHLISFAGYNFCTDFKIMKIYTAMKVRQSEKKEVRKIFGIYSFKIANSYSENIHPTYNM